MPKLIVTEYFTGYDISWDYSNDKFDLLGEYTKSQFKLDDTSTDPEIVELKKCLSTYPGARMIEFLGRTTPIFKTRQEAQNCIDDVIEPYFLAMQMGKKAV